MIAPKPELIPSVSKVQQHAFVLAYRFSVAKYALTFVDPVRLNRLLSRDMTVTCRPDRDDRGS